MRQRTPATALAVALLIAACGGGDDDSSADAPADDSSPAGEETDEPAEDTPAPEPEPEPEPDPEPEPEPEPPSEVTSPDGLLTITPPDDAPGITIEEATPAALPEVDAGVADVLGAYELGPSGATFDPPLVLEFSIDPAVTDPAATGFAVTHELDDGTTEALEPTVTDSTIQFELSSFSSVTLTAIPQQRAAVVLRAPDRADVDQPFEAQLDLDFDAGVSVGNRVTSPDGATITGTGAVVAQTSPNTFVCESADPGSVEFDGSVFVAIERDPNYSASYQFPRLAASAPVECVAGTVIEPTDVRYLDRATGNPVEPFLTGAQLTPTVSVDRDASTFTLTIVTPADALPTVSVGGPTSDGSFRLIETNIDAITGFFGNNFAGFVPDPGFATVTQVELDDGTVRTTFTITLPCGIDGMYRTFVGGTAMDGGQPVAPIDVMVNDVTVFVETPDGLQAIIFFDPIAGPLVDIDGFATCP